MKRNSAVRRIFTYSGLLACILYFVMNMYAYRYRFLQKFDQVYMGNVYSNSQYVKGNRSDNGIGDDGLYAFAGYYYFFNRGDVSAVNFEHPPLGKYLIGLSIFLFGNENAINLIYVILLAVFAYKLGRELDMGKEFSLLAAGILLADPLILNHTINSMLDLPFSLFILMGIYYFLRGYRQKNIYFFCSSLFLALAFSVRFFPSILVLYAVFIFYLVRYRQPERLAVFLLSTCLIPAVYTMSHLSYFVYHPSIAEFIRHKIWMLSWFKGSAVIPGNIWSDLFTGRFIDSSGHAARNEYWTVLVPVVTFFYLTAALILKGDQQKKMLYSMTFLYLLYVTFLTVGYQKFIMPVYPVMVLLSLQAMEAFYSIITSWLPKKLKK